MPPTDPGTLAQQLKLQLLTGDKALNKNQKKKARKKVTKILQKALGVSPRPGGDADTGARSDDDLPPSSQDTGRCSNRRHPGGTGDPTPTCTSNPHPVKQAASLYAPGFTAAAPHTTDAAHGQGQLQVDGAAAAAAAAAAMPPPKRCRLNSGAGTFAADGDRRGGKPPQAPPPGGGAQAEAEAGRGAGRRKVRGHAVAATNGRAAAAPAGSSRLTGGDSRSVDGSGGSGAAPSGGSSRLSHGAMKRLSRRPAKAEDLLTADDGGDGDGPSCAGGEDASGVVVAAVATAAIGGSTDAAAGKQRRDRRQRGRQWEKPVRPLDGGGAAASEEVIQIPPQAGTAAAAAAAAAAVHRSYGLYGSIMAVTTAVAAAATITARVAMPAAVAGVAAAASRGPADLSAALLMMRVQLRTGGLADGSAASTEVAAAAMVSDTVTFTGVTASVTTGVSSGSEEELDGSPTGSGGAGGRVGAQAVAAVAAAAAEAGPTASGSQQQKKKKKPQRTEEEAAARAALYRYGNYHRYYGYRLGSDLDEDPRVKLMRREWFQQRAVIDVGCNEGLVTLAVAARFGVRRMIGYDIDGALIKKACRNLRIMRTEYTTRLQAATLGRGSGGGGFESAGGCDDVFLTDAGDGVADGGEQHDYSGEEQEPADREGPGAGRDIDVEAGSDDGVEASGAEGDLGGSTRQRDQQQTRGQHQQQPRPRRGPTSAAGPAPLRVGQLRSYVRALAGTSFVQQDWANARGRPESADTILCLSVTKWVHLNNGDAGLKRLFKKCFDTLAPGGLLVLEPQPWKSYKRAVHKTTTNAVPFKRIEQLQLRPQHFVEYLTTQVGFVLESRLHEGEGVGFDRPMVLLRKPAPPAAPSG